MSFLGHSLQMERISFEEIYLGLAQSLAKRSTCKRLQVGAVITSPDFRSIYGIGYNGNATDLANSCDTEVPGSCGCLHAEINAIINNQAPRVVEKVVFITHAPCKACAKSLLNLGNVVRVIYIHEYRITEGVQVLESSGVEVKRW